MGCGDSDIRAFGQSDLLYLRDDSSEVTLASAESSQLRFRFPALTLGQYSEVIS